MNTKRVKKERTPETPFVVSRSEHGMVIRATTGKSCAESMAAHLAWMQSVTRKYAEQRDKGRI